VFKLNASTLAPWVSALGAFLSDMTFVALAVYYVQVVGMNPLQLVLVGTVLEGTIFLLEIPTGVLADAYSRRFSVVVGQILVGICFIIEGLVPLFPAILAAEVIRGLGETFRSGAWEAWMADEVGEEHFGRLYARAGQAGYVGALAGLGAGVALAAARLSLAPLAGGVGMVALGALMAVAMPEKRRPGAVGRLPWRALWHTAWARLRADARDTLRQGRQWLRPGAGLALLLAASFLVGGYSEGFDRLWEAHLLADLAFPSLGDLQPVAWFGIINAGSMLLGMMASELVVRRVNMADPARMARTLMRASLILTAAVVGFGLARQFAVALAAIWLRALAGAVYDPVYAAWLNRRATSEVRATVFSMSGQANALGQFAFGPALGWVGTRASLRAAFLAAAGLLLPLAAIFGRQVRAGTVAEAAAKVDPS
jgi:DHA3 family tetracycline resistance protein-like MFS transporter